MELSRSLAVVVVLGVGAVGCGAEVPAPPELGQLSLAVSSGDRGGALDSGKSLLITDPSVIASPLETTFDPASPSGQSREGAWSFGRLVHNLLPASERDSAAAASALVFRWLGTWETALQVNPSVSPAPARGTIRQLVTNRWKALSGCAEPESSATDDDCVLDFTQAPFQLIAIVNRPDLRVVSDDDSAIGGEGRFVFQVVGPTLGVSAATGALEVMDATVKPQKFTVIFEYSLPVMKRLDTLQWAHRWEKLSQLPFGRGFNSVLVQITNGFAGPDADPRRVNGNALNQLRTNEVALAGARFPSAGFVAARQFWELREFRLTADGLTPHTVNLEPARDFDIGRTGYTGREGTRSAELTSFLTSSADAVLAHRQKLPEGWSASSALVGSAPYGAWGKRVNPNPPAIPSQGVASDLSGVPVAVRDAFALDTCAGCHRHETDTRHFMHLTTVAAMEPADKVDDRARIGVGPEVLETTVVVSNFLRDELAVGGPRRADYEALLGTLPPQLKDKPGLRACGR